MGGSSNSQIVGYRYALGAHLALCHGPVDAIREILVDRRTAWSVTTGGGFTGGGAAVETRIGTVAAMAATAALAGDAGATISFPGTLAGMRIARDYRLGLANGASQTTLSMGFDVRKCPQCSAGKSKNASIASLSFVLCPLSFVRQATPFSYLTPYFSEKTLGSS
jgi:hypothetical protein